MKKTFALFLLMLALPAFAHPGHDSNPLQDGLLHPLTGLDHLLMLLGTGVIAALTRRNLTLPLATLAAMFGGAVCGHLFGDVLGMETLIAVSLLVAAGAVLLPSRQSLLAMAMPVFALFHGWAHGVEATPSAFWQFSAGFVVVSGLLLAAGFAVGCCCAATAACRRPLAVACWPAPRWCWPVDEQRPGAAAPTAVGQPRLAGGWFYLFARPGVGGRGRLGSGRGQFCRLAA